MRISNNHNNIKFRANIGQDYSTLEKEIKIVRKAGTIVNNFDRLNNSLDKIEKSAIAQINAGKKEVIPRIFNPIVRWFGKVKIDKTGNKAIDTASMLTKIVLWGNVGKELVGTSIYTVQALTNEDLPQDKRKFVGMYDLAVGLVSTTCSFAFLTLEPKIKSGYKKLLKPLTDSPATKSKAAASIVGLAAFTSFALQTIVGKRIVAPAIATPVAGIFKRKLEEMDAEKKETTGTEKEPVIIPIADALVLAKNKPVSSSNNLLKIKADDLNKPNAK